MAIWTELSWPRIKGCAERGQVVIVPVGVIEQHGHHLPVDTDAFLAQEIARAAERRDPEILVGPTIPFGFTPSNKNFPGTISVRADTWMGLIRDVVRSIARHGFARIALLNGHGGQIALGQATSASIQGEDGITVVFLSWFGMVEDAMSRLFSDEGMRGSRVGHAGAVETSMNLHLRPHLAAQGSPIPNVVAWTPDYVSAVRGYVQAPREAVSPSGVMGDPRLASVEKGAELFNLAVERLCTFAGEFRRSAGAPWQDAPVPEGSPDQPQPRPAAAAG